MNGPMEYFLLGFVLIQAIQVSLAGKCVHAALLMDLFVEGLVMVALCNRETIYIFMLWFVLLLPSSFFFMVALCNRADHYIFAL